MTANPSTPKLAAVQILLIRHGLTVEDQPRLSDAQRHLSVKGRKVVRSVAQVVRGLSVEPDAFVVCPHVSAVQTAELFAEQLDFMGEVEVLHALTSGIPPHIAAKDIAQRGQLVVVVAHEPTLSALGAFLTARPAFPPLRPAQVSVLQDGRPLWFIHPETLAQDRLLIA